MKLCENDARSEWMELNVNTGNVTGHFGEKSFRASTFSSQLVALDWQWQPNHNDHEKKKHKNS